MEENEEFRTCPRCHRHLSKSYFVKELCSRCHDILEFGYPSFTAFKLDEPYNKNQSQRMDLSEGWILPAYIFKK